MAPEVIMETEHTYKCDIWSLGITILEMAEGAPPHSNIHPFRALFLIPKKPPPTFSDTTKWSADAIDFVSQCLQKLPHERPSAIELLMHPFIMKRTTGPEVLRSTIITYLKAKKEKQMKLKREIAKLGRKALNGNEPTSPLVSPLPSPRVEMSSSSPSLSRSPDSVPISPLDPPPPPSLADGIKEILINSYNSNNNTNNNPNINNEEAQGKENGTDNSSKDEESSDSTELGSPADYQTMFVLGSLNTLDMPINTNLVKEEEEPKQVNTKRYSGEFLAVRQMIIDTKIEICRVREEVSSQNAIMKSELHEIKSKLTDLTALLLAITNNTTSTPPITLKKKTSDLNFSPRGRN